MRRLEYRTLNARRSSEAIPAIGTCRTWASVLAVAIPTRIPVNSPGPSPTAIPPSCPISVTDHRMRCVTFGMTTSWFALFLEINVAATIPRSVPRATVVCGVDVSMPRTSTSGGLPGLRDLLEPLPPQRPALRRRGDLDAAAGVVLDRDLDLQRGLGQERLDGVAPLDEHDVPGVEHLVEPQVEDVLQPLQ